MNVTQLGAFIIASAIVIVVPGVYMALFTRQVLLHGRRAAFITLAGGFRRGQHPVAGSAQPSRTPMALSRAYLLGLGSNLTNPKMAVFFLTFLPQFVIPGPTATAQTAALGMLFCAMAGVWFVIYILALGRLAPWLGRPRVRSGLPGRSWWDSVSVSPRSDDLGGH